MIRPRLMPLAASVAGLAVAGTPAAAQDRSMPGMTMPMPAPAAHPAAKKPVRKPPPRKPAPARASTPTMPGMAMPGMAMPDATKPPADGGMSMAGMDMTGAPAGHPMAMPDPAIDPTAATGTALPAGTAPAPPVPADHYADRQFGTAAMAPARAQMMRESGAQRLSMVLVNLAEYQIRDGRDGYRWDGEGWFGGDIDRVVIKSEGSGTKRDGIDAAEVQALFSRAIGPYVDLQAGVRHDVAPTPTRTYATVGVEGLAPYMVETAAAAFVSTKGELFGRLEGWYDQRLTQRLVLQPRVELNLAAQDMPDTRVGAGLSEAELGLRLRYEIARTFAPYIGLSHEAKTGRTADYTHTDGKGAAATSLVAGIRFWF